MERYNKLVRDNIPTLLIRKKVRHKTRIASKGEFREMLDRKFREEAEKFLKSQNLEELADITEVILAIAEEDSVSKDEFQKVTTYLRKLCLSIGHTQEELEVCRQEKLRELGGFLRNIILVYTE